jgi:hypothetical protein
VKSLCPWCQTIVAIVHFVDPPGPRFEVHSGGDDDKCCRGSLQKAPMTPTTSTTVGSGPGPDSGEGT